MSVAHKNLFELLGNDPDSDGEVRAPAKEVVKKTTSTKKKEVVVEAPAPTQQRANRGGRKYAGSEGAFRDRDAGSNRNRERTTDNTGEHTHDGPRRGGRGGARGGHRGNRQGQGREFDRHSQTGRVDTAKATGQGWGANTGNSEWNDEEAGKALAEKAISGSGAGWEANDPAAAEVDQFAEGKVEAAKEDGEAAAEEPEEKVKTLEEYKAELAARQANLGPPPAVRRPNEGSRDNKKWANAVLKEDKEEEVLFAGKEAKAKAPKERKVKQIVDIDATQFDARADSKGGRGGRGGRGENRGDRRGGPRGGRGEGRGEFRGERRAPAPQAGRGTVVKLDDPKAFPSLGA